MTAPQSEAELEKGLIEQLISLGYDYVTIKNEDDLLVNFRQQLILFNNLPSLSDSEFNQILNQLQKGSIFEKAKTLREKMDYKKDNGDTGYISFLGKGNTKEEWCQNRYQVTNQIKMVGKYDTRYDVTILINGLPLVQIELKRRGLELKEAFNQTNRYERFSYNSGFGLFQYIQIFVISNGVNTKYYANNKIGDRNFKQTFYWSDVHNNLITRLREFSYVFFDTCHISKMLSKYIVLNESENNLMVLRPYQFYAVEAIIDRVKNTDKFGYIWHTTGSGKTLTSFKASQILMGLPDIAKVVFVVDRKDLDFQTTKEFNSFSKGSIDGTANTKSLVKQFNDPNCKLIVTTIQKLDVAIKKERYRSVMEQFQDKKLVFIFDECHRSQFGDTHQRIKKYFPKGQLFGFTGTPIFKDNATVNQTGKHTTAELFLEPLHKYVITDAIRDENVLKFSVEYINTVRRKDQIVDINVEAIDTKEVMEDPQRLDIITDYIIANHNRKTHSREFTAMFCVPNIPVLINYYELFKKKGIEGKHNLRIATIFSYQSNEEDKEAKGFVMDDDELLDEPETQYAHSREKLDEYIADYNKMFGSNFSTKDSKSFYNYYNDISQKVKNKHIDILLVVNMFLTGFDSKHLNTLYVDKNLKYHGLIQAYSRTNRILNELKSQGNIVCFRNLKSATDEAVTLFSNKDAISEIMMPPYEELVKEFNLAVVELIKIAPTVNSVNHLADENEELKFITAFRQLIRLKNKLEYFSDFEFNDLAMNEQLFNDYRSKYLDLYDKVRFNQSVEKVSILEDVNFEVELIHRDEINVAYILRLLAKMKGETPEEQIRLRKSIDDLMSGEVQLRSKRELIDKFLNENLLLIEDEDDVEKEFYKFWDEQRIVALQKLSEEENLNSEKLQKLIGNYLFTEKTPLRDDIIDTMNQSPSLKERRSVAERVLEKVKKYIETFIEGM